MAVDFVLHAHAGGAQRHAAREVQVDGVDSDGGAGEDVGRGHVRVVIRSVFGLGAREVRDEALFSGHAVVF